MRTLARRAAAAAGVAALIAAAPAAGQAGVSADPDRPPATDWKMYGGDPQRTFWSDDTTIEEDTVFRMAEKWRFIIPNASSDNSVTASPVVYKGVVYFGDWKGRFYAVDAADGSLVWQRDLKANLVKTLERTLPEEEWDKIDARGTAIYSTALAHNGRIYTGVGQVMYALDAKTGKTVWKRNIMDRISRLHGDNGAPFYSSPTIVRNADLKRKVIYVGTPSTDCVRGVLRAIEPKKGRVLWSYYVDGGREKKAGEYRPDGKPAMGGGLWTSPTISPDGETAYITTSNACGIPAQPELAPALIAVDTAGGKLPSRERIKWVAQSRSNDLDDRAIANTPNYMANVITPGGSLVDLVGYADKDGSYRAFWAEDIGNDGAGDRVWRTDVAPTADEKTGGGFVGGGTAYAYGRVFAGSFLGPPFMHAFNAWNGAVEWQSPVAGPSFGAVTVANDMVFKGDEGSNSVKVYDHTDGALLRVLETPETVVGAPAVVDRHVILTLGSSRPWEGLPSNPSGVGVMAFLLPERGASNQIPPFDPNPPLSGGG